MKRRVKILSAISAAIMLISGSTMLTSAATPICIGGDCGNVLSNCIGGSCNALNGCTNISDVLNNCAGGNCANGNAIVLSNCSGSVLNDLMKQYGCSDLNQLVQICQNLVPEAQCSEPQATEPAETPTQPVTQTPTQAPTQPATQVSTQAPTQPATQAPTQTPTQPATQAPTQASTQPAASAEYNQAYADEVIRLVNIERAKYGLNPLAKHDGATAVANVRAKEIVQSFSHTRPNGTSCFTAAQELGVSYRSAGENIAYGYPDPQAVVTGWMNSEGHRANILSSNFSSIGVGCYQSGRTLYWSQFFIG